jgi:sensor histidine kinase YesM
MTDNRPTSRSIRTEILIKGIASILLPLCLFAVIHLVSVSKTLSEHARSNQMQTTVQMRDTLDTVLGEIEQSALNLADNALIKQIVSNPTIDNDSFTRLRLQSQLDTLFFTFFGSRPEIGYINLSGDNFQFILHTDPLRSYREGTYNAYLDKTTAISSGKSGSRQSTARTWSWIPSISMLESSFADTYVYLVISLHDPDDYDSSEIGRIVVGVDRLQLSSTVGKTRQAMKSEGSGILLDDGSIIQLHNISTPIPDDFGTTISDHGYSTTFRRAGKTWMTSAFTSARTGWLVYKSAPKSAVLSGLITLMTWTLIAMAACIALAIGAAFPLAGRIAGPLSLLSTKHDTFLGQQKMDSNHVPEQKSSPQLHTLPPPIPLGQQLASYFLLIVLIPLTVFIVASLALYTTSFKTESDRYHREVTTQFGTMLEHSYSGIQQSAKRIWTNLEFQRALVSLLDNRASGPETAINSDNLQVMQHAITREFLLYKDLRYIQVLDMQGSELATVSFAQTQVPKLTMSDLTLLEHGSGRFLTLPVRNDVVGTPILPMGNIISCILQDNPRIGGQLGYLVIALDTRWFETILNRFPSDSVERLSVVTNDGVILYSLMQENSGATVLSQFVPFKPEKPTALVLDEHQQGSLILSYPTGFASVLQATFHTGLFEPVTGPMLVNSIITFVVAALSIVLMLRRLSRTISIPVLLLEQAMSTAHEDIGSELFIPDPRTALEIQVLARSFNQMTRRISALIDHSVQIHAKRQEAELRQREAEIISLQSQINPHFLYNTLDTINWMALAQLGRENQISQIVISLANLFRDSLADSKSFISVSRQLRLVEDYVSIQKHRYGERLSVTMDIDERVLSCSSIPLILQPLVENSIVHGIGKREQGGHLVIRAKLVEQTVVMEVEDDGMGIPSEQLHALNEELLLKVDRKNKRSIGLHNTNLRLRSVFGDMYGITVESTEGAGTCVRLTLPAISFEQPTPHTG